MTRTSIAAEVAQPADGLAELPGVHGLEVDGAPRALRRRHRPPRRRGAPARRARRAQPRQPPADARGAVPPALRRRAAARGRARRPPARPRAVTTTDGLAHRRSRRSRGSPCAATGCASSCGSPRSCCVVVVDRREHQGPLPQPGRARQGRAGVGGQRRPPSSSTARPQGLDTVGGQVAFQTGTFGLILMGLMSVFMLGRLTRGEEEAGRSELVRSLPVGPHSLAGRRRAHRRAP